MPFSGDCKGRPVKLRGLCETSQAFYMKDRSLAADPHPFVDPLGGFLRLAGNEHADLPNGLGQFFAPLPPTCFCIALEEAGETSVSKSP
jgi:hypothetical protein